MNSRSVLTATRATVTPSSSVAVTSSNSRAFSRYRNIDEEMAKEVILKLE